MPLPWRRHAMPSWCCSSCCPPQDVHLWLTLCSLCSPTQQTAQRPSNFVARLHPGTTTGEGSRSWEHSSDGMTSCSVALEEDIPCGVLLQGDGGFKDGEAHIMSRQSGRGTVDQESGSAGEMGLDTEEVTSSTSWTRLTSQRCRNLPAPGSMSDETPSPPHTCSVFQLHSQDVGRWL